MKLVASVIVRNELDRYLAPCIDHLLEFCDEVRVLDDASTDGTDEYLQGIDRVVVARTLGPNFFKHEGQARQRLLDFTLEGEPTHVLAIDADEFVTDGAAVRTACTRMRDVFALNMVETWEAHDHGLCVRTDGGWWTHPVNALWRTETRRRTGPWRIADRALACGRVPTQVNRARGFLVDAEILHFGWTNEQERRARYDRYAINDGGRFHRSTHLESIMWDCDKVRLQWHEWPAGLDKAALLERANRELVA